MADLSSLNKPEAKTICHKGRVINEEEAAFILHAIGQYERLVAMETALSKIHIAAYSPDIRKRAFVALTAARAALLKEEKP